MISGNGSPRIVKGVHPLFLEYDEPLMSLPPRHLITGLFDPLPSVSPMIINILPSVDVLII